MTAMPLHLAWTDLLARLASTLTAGLVIGYNREEYGKAAGMRTTLIVCLAACVAMIQVNLLLSLGGRAANSFVMNDLMRLPLGVLTGVGFIGAGTILRRKDVVVGVTTAATLWLVTIIGLCFGGGQVALGWIATGLGLVALWGLGRLERRVVRERTARLVVECSSEGPGEADLHRRLGQAGLTIAGSDVSLDPAGTTVFVLDVRYFARASSVATPDAVHALTHERGVARVRWSAPA